MRSGRRNRALARPCGREERRGIDRSARRGREAIEEEREGLPTFETDAGSVRWAEPFAALSDDERIVGRRRRGRRRRWRSEEAHVERILRCVRLALREFDE